MVETAVVQSDQKGNQGRRYYRCPRSQVSALFSLQFFARIPKDPLMPFQVLDEDREQLCTFEFLWHEKYKRTLEVSGGNRRPLRSPKSNPVG